MRVLAFLFGMFLGAVIVGQVAAIYVADRMPDRDIWDITESAFIADEAEAFAGAIDARKFPLFYEELPEPTIGQILRVLRRSK